MSDVHEYHRWGTSSWVRSAYFPECRPHASAQHALLAALSHASCCKLTCATLMCPAEFVPDVAELAPTTLSQLSRCKAICATFTCPANYIAQPLLAASTFVSQTSCCQATCAASTYSVHGAANPDRTLATSLIQGSFCPAACAGPFRATTFALHGLGPCKVPAVAWIMWPCLGACNP